MRIYNIELNEGKQLIISNGFFSLPRRHFLASSRNLSTRRGKERLVWRTQRVTMAFIAWQKFKATT